MSYFPFFYNIENLPVLLIGGGRVAARRGKALLDAGAVLTVIAPEIDAALDGTRVRRICREFQAEDLNGYSIVVAASSDHLVNRLVGEACQKRGIPVNVADDPGLSSFLFPAVVRRGAVTVGITTGGAAPGVSKWVSAQVEAAIPDGLGEIIPWLEAVRQDLKMKIASQKGREAVLRRLLAESLLLGRPLTPEETRAMMDQEMDG